MVSCEQLGGIHCPIQRLNQMEGLFTTLADSNADLAQKRYRIDEEKLRFFCFGMRMGGVKGHSCRNEQHQ